MADIRTEIHEHFGEPCEFFPVVRHEVQTYERPNLQLALDEFVSEAKKSSLVGVIERDYDATLTRLVSQNAVTDFSKGPVEFLDCELGPDERLTCVKRGLYLVESADGDRSVILVGAAKDDYPPRILLEVMARSQKDAETVLRHLTRAVRLGKAYRGRVFSLGRDYHGAVHVKFHTLPEITRESIILPAVLLERIERHTISFSRHAARLRECGRHLKRGLLLHGSPGTGKTLTAMYLVSRMVDRTVIILTGEGMGSIEAACHLARMLEPATVILEDVDLIGTQRGYQTLNANALLFELLNQMDGLGEDCDVLFVLTTNRPDELEPALASRPGRIDQAFEVPLPDSDCRKRLLELYGKGLHVEMGDAESIVERLDGASAAFIRELLRKASLLAADDDDQVINVRQRHLEEALTELLVAGGRLTQTLLGAREGRVARGSNGE
ncbi:MAG: ATP-binding protein [Pirellulaceae bacterium]|nr:ATP-binding protein [Planctomycetales bacterium]